MRKTANPLGAGKAEPIRQEMAEIDQRMTQLRTHCKVTSPSACRAPTSGNRNAQIQKLEKRKADLQKL